MRVRRANRAEQLRPHKRGVGEGRLRVGRISEPLRKKRNAKGTGKPPGEAFRLAFESGAREGTAKVRVGTSR